MNELNHKSDSKASPPNVRGDTDGIYNFRKIEKEWQQKWKDTEIYKVSNSSHKPRCYVLDMFPYPSGAGLHVGHPLGYIASDIYARYKRLKGFNVLHPMGYDSFGLPAEQYALETGQHPAITTEKNIETFRSQLDNIGFCFDWSREVRTSDPKYYKWTQWIFLQIFNSWYDKKQCKARKIEELIKIFEKEGSSTINYQPSAINKFTANEWQDFTDEERQEILMNYRLAYSAFGEVNWCEALGTVLANDEVINGVSERGGHPVVKKKMRQWYLRITDYAERLLQGLETVDFSDAMKEMQRNWIGRSEGAELRFRLIPAFPPGGEGGRNGATEFLHSGGEKRGAALVPKYSVSSIVQFENAKRMRKEFTEAENMLWQQLRNNRLNAKFRRQHPIDSYIVDFICLQQKLIVEIDGGYHETEDQKKLDDERTKILAEIGFNVIRFTNNEVANSIDSVLEKIKKTLLPPLIPTFSPRGEGRDEGVLVYTTRPDTIFGADFMVLAPEHDLVDKITTSSQREEIEKYLEYVNSRSERERLTEVKSITGAFTGAYAINPFNERAIPIWISEYVLAGYGTGAIMAVPCGDERDFAFAKHFNIPITNIIGDHFDGLAANPTKDATLTNSGFLNGIIMKDAIPLVLKKIEEMGIGKRKVNYKMRDAGFSRQRYWGEPFPIIYKNGVAYAVDEKELPVELPHVDEYKAGPEGEGPLANITEWVNPGDGIRRETNTMPGYAGSSWYFLRYMDPHNYNEFADRKITDYWNQVDVYVGGTEHAVGHLLYSRLWTKILFDLGYISFEEPYKKLLNQGMIQGSSRFVYRLGIQNLTPSDENNFSFKNEPVIYLSQKPYHHVLKLKDIPADTIQYINSLLPNIYNSRDISDLTIIHLNEVHVDVNLVDGVELDIEAFRNWKPEYKDATYILDEGQVLSPGKNQGEVSGKFICGVETEKMSKSKYNTVNPNELIEKYGADTFRMYEMFLGPVEQSKPWDTKGIEGVHRFLKKLWRLFYGELKGRVWNNEKATEAELKVLHKTIKKIEEDTERFSYNTAVSAFMVCVNDLTDLKCHKKEILEPLLILMTPYAPHIAEELYQLLKSPSPPGERSGEGGSILDASFPVFEPKYLVETSKEYPISINGRMRTTIIIAIDASPEQVEEIVLSNDVVKKWLDGKSPKKVIYVKNKMVNVVV